MSAYLRLNIDDTQINIEVLSTADFPVNGGVVQIGSEKISYTTATTQSILGCTRGYDGSSAASHLAGIPVTLLSSPLPLVGPREFSDSVDPTDNLTGVGISSVGDRYTNTTSGEIFINVSGSATPTWTSLATGSGSAAWGAITGTLSDQTDLQTALDAKEDIVNKSDDATLADNSDTLYPTQSAVKHYVDAHSTPPVFQSNNTTQSANASEVNLFTSVDSGMYRLTFNAVVNSAGTDSGTEVYTVHCVDAMYGADLTLPVGSLVLSVAPSVTQATVIFTIGAATSLFLNSTGGTFVDGNVKYRYTIEQIHLF